ncbi:MAG TPA: hypothetical protein VKU00_04325, partial [Chthonomonadaceae bacterium]|nr:hypothetical protein [Chthonomonadaceae bacterium]
YTSEANRGYLRGCAFARARWLEEHALQPTLVGIANTDLALAGDFFVQLLTQALPERVAVLAPRITLPDGTLQNPFLRVRPNRARMFGYTLLYRSALLTGCWQWLHSRKNRLRRAGKPQVGAPRQRSLAPDYTPYAAHGSLFFLRPNFFERGGTLDYPTFLFGEEIFIAEQVRAFGLKVAYLPSARVLHNAHTSTDRIASRRRARWMHESACFLWRRHFS